jgi:hypothetical protein
LTQLDKPNAKQRSESGPTRKSLAEVGLADFVAGEEFGAGAGELVLAGDDDVAAMGDADITSEVIESICGHRNLKQDPVAKDRATKKGSLHADYK